MLKVSVVMPTLNEEKALPLVVDDIRKHTKNYKTEILIVDSSTDDTAANNNTGHMLKEFLSDETSPDPAELARNRDLQRIVIESLSKLDDNHRTVLILRDIEGMNYAQIADVLDIELGTVKS